MKKIQYIITLCAILVLQNCVSSPLPTLITITTQHPTTYSAGSKISSAKIVKSGESCSTSSYLFDIVLFFYGSGGGVEDAKRQGKITKVATIDRSSVSILFALFYRECTVVWGE
jgi:hypothetical protein